MGEDQLHLTHLGACRTAFRWAPEACSKVLLVGEDNPLSAAPEHALFCAPDGCSGHRLQDKILGLPRLTYLAIWRTNLCAGRWSTAEARERAHDLYFTASRPWSHLVLLGRKVAGAFERAVAGGLRLRPFEAAHLDERGRVDDLRRISTDVTLVSLPHPSGRNLVWNDESRRIDARRLLRALVPEVFA